MAKTVEETYQKKTPKEHILLRPDTYIGSVDKDTQTMYVWSDEEGRIVARPICYAPGLYKIFDEILVNAADNKIRDPRMKELRVDIDAAGNEISVRNDGKGIPVMMHAKEGVYVPELIFGHLLTSSNYDDKEKKVTGGRNGYGAKLCNIFSTRFEVETSDGKRTYRQVFERNMDVVHPPEISGRVSGEYTRIVFSPDLRRFGMERLDEDIVALMKKRVYDMCGTLGGVRVYLNGALLAVDGFKAYVSLYMPRGSEEETVPVVHQKINARWEVAVAVVDEQFSQVSFVNSIATTKGGTHVVHVLDQLVEPVMEALKKKEKGLDVKPVHVRSSLFLFVNALIENPSFDSQTKENLTLRASAFGSRCAPIESFIKEVLRKTPLLERVLTFSRAKQSAQLKKSDGAKTSRLSGIAKLEDANSAGTRRSAECTLILTEGDSAKTLAVAGLSVVGRDLYGVFPLRGKLLNVREASHQQIMANAEISSIKKILGLQHGKTYEDVTALRYGHIMIMTDQDHDGSHIKGLIINFLDHFYPSLLQVPGFLREFITPIIRATRKRRNGTEGRNGIERQNDANTEVRDFFTIPEYEAFKEAEMAANGGMFRWTVKYYKGLGTSTPKDAKQYFSDLTKHVKDFRPCSETDRTLIDLAFSKKKADLRKGWLSDFVPGTYLDQSAAVIGIADFINRELILFSMADNVRSIPSVVDGLKPGQRKVLFSCFKRNLHAEIKVAQLVGYVSEQSAYHHGEASLCATIVNLAHDFVGSNNINLLLPLGSFGSRLQGGRDAASPRYIYTSLSPLARLLLPEHDDPVLSYLQDDNLRIEPVFYVPIIPLVLVNGADGIGTGWSTSIPNYDPLDIAANVRRLIAGTEMQPMTPHYRNFRGTISETAPGKFAVSGVSSTTDGLISVTELPVATWTQTYKEHLEALVQSGAVYDYKEYHTEKTVDFLISPLKSFPLRLVTTISTSNMICFDAAGKIRRYSSPLDIIRDFFPTRLEFYRLRKQHRLAAIAGELSSLRNRVRFIREVAAGELIISRRPLGDIRADLSARGYDACSSSDPADGYAYLLGMKIASLTHERMAALSEELDKKQKEHDRLALLSPQDLWVADLDAFEIAYRKLVADEAAEYDHELKKKVKPSARKIRKPVGKISGITKEKSATKEKSTTKEKGTTKSTKAKKAVTTEKAKSNSTKPKKKTVSPKESITKKTIITTSSEEETVLSFKKARTNKASLIISSDSSDSEKPWDKYKTS